MLNGAPAAIRALGRDRAPARLAGFPGLVAPPTRRITRDELAAVEAGFPVIVRPVDSHAGAGLEKLDAPGDVAGYLARQLGERFYVQPFIDYAGPDGPA